MKIFGFFLLSVFAWFVLFVVNTEIDKKHGKDYIKAMNENAAAAAFLVILIWILVLGIYFVTK